LITADMPTVTLPEHEKEAWHQDTIEKGYWERERIINMVKSQIRRAHREGRLKSWPKDKPTPDLTRLLTADGKELTLIYTGTEGTNGNN